MVFLYISGNMISSIQSNLLMKTLLRKFNGMSNTLNQINCYLKTYTNTMKHVLYRASMIMCDS